MLECKLCAKSLTSHLAKKLHIFYCKVLTEADSRRRCRYCKQELPTTFSFLHEHLCPKNAELPVQTMLKTTKVRCPKCSKHVKYSRVPSHMVSHCLRHLNHYVTTGSLLKKSAPSDYSQASKSTKDAVPTSALPVLINNPNILIGYIKVKIKCAFCEKSFPGNRIYQHSGSCVKLLSLLKVNFSCHFCEVETNEVDCLVHEAICSKNPNAGTIRKIKCNSSGCNGIKPNTIKELRKHIGQCSKSVVSLANMSIQRYWSAITAIDCAYCHNTIKGLELFQHAGFCQPLLEHAKLATTARNCRFCQDESNEIDSLLHEIQCEKNPTKGLVWCDNCDWYIDGTMLGFQKHIGQCNKTLLRLTNKSIEDYFTKS